MQRRSKKMAYKPRSATVTTNPEMIVNPDANRDVVVITNLTGSTIYWGVDPELSMDNGAPIFNNGRAEFTRQNGRDPTIARYLVIAAGSGDVRIDEESTGSGDKLIPVLEKISTILEKLTTVQFWRS
jgi:hypothetical protein